VSSVQMALSWPCKVGGAWQGGRGGRGVGGARPISARCTGWGRRRAASHRKFIAEGTWSILRPGVYSSRCARLFSVSHCLRRSSEPPNTLLVSSTYLLRSRLVSAASCALTSGSARQSASPCRSRTSSTISPSWRGTTSTQTSLKRSLHCLPLRPGSCEAITAHLRRPCTLTSCWISWSSCQTPCAARHARAMALGRAHARCLRTEMSAAATRARIRAPLLSMACAPGPRRRPCRPGPPRPTPPAKPARRRPLFED
jgi:hypothetical protein